MTDDHGDQLLNELAKETYLDDAGFTHGVLRRLPRARPGFRTAILCGCGILCAGLVAFAFPPVEPLLREAASFVTGHPIPAVLLAGSAAILTALGLELA
jgi:hypothetical protein